MIVGALVMAVPASAHTGNNTRRWGKPPRTVTLWRAQGGRLSATRGSDRQVSFTFVNESNHRIYFFCVWHETRANGALQRRQWRGGVRAGKFHRHGPHPTRVFPKDATCTLS
ncbi:MAG: hypothetical protein QOI81_2410 [Actinomycetota bacterium]|nr:hypothetical protein [Actinomycetota bacterium]